MRGLMQDWPLVVSTIIDHAEREHGEREIVSRSVEGPIRTTTWADIARRSRQVAKALTAEGIKPGDRIATMAWNTDRHIEWFTLSTTRKTEYYLLILALYPLLLL